MPNAIYDAGPSLALDVYRRYDAGHLTDNLLRYKGDVYDRLWRELLNSYMDCVGLCVNITSSSAVDVLNSDDLYRPPPELLRTATRAPNKTFQLGFHIQVSSYVSRTEPMHVYFHFAEIEKLKAGQRREMFISSGGKNLHESFTLDYLVPLTIGPIELPIVMGVIQFSIESQKLSGLPPIVNGIEIFRVLELAQGVLTDSQDVDAIMNIKEMYNLSRKWRGDPCVNSSWEGVSCSTSRIPRIIMLNLNSSGLTGVIAAPISNLTAIQYLDLSNNYLTGPIPEFLASSTSLKFLNLAGNNLTGSVPKALLQKSISGALTLRLDNNTNLCSLDSCEGKDKKWPIIPVVTSAAVFMLLVIALVIWGALQISAMKKMDSFKSKSQKFTQSQITSITENFKTVIGEGGFGKVYLGTLANGLKVAVKLLSSESKQGAREFSQEIKLLMRVHHGNVVSLVGYCSDPKSMALVYEYMPNGNLKDHLSGHYEGVVLSWQDRIQIAVHAAQGLDYLHNSCVPRIIHCDLKTSNILLDENKQAKLADFGLSKAFKLEDATHVTATTGAGTPGYIDPVCEESPKFSRRSDMYSFGVILLELVTGKPALIGGIHGISLLDWVLPQYNNGEIPSIVDERLHGNYSIDGAQNLLMIAISCLNSNAYERPGINEVLAELKQCLGKENIQSGTSSCSKPKCNSAGSSHVSLEAEISQLSAR
uniref:non-specific serine/threonine protein kinase n=1 Tax=Kalanchoe fedtschenkoi TaxID=63787 RepID=A0A7N0TXB7_KALFE